MCISVNRSVLGFCFVNRRHFDILVGTNLQVKLVKSSFLTSRCAQTAGESKFNKREYVIG